MRKHVTKAERARVEAELKKDIEEHYRDKTAPERESQAEGLGPRGKIRKHEEER